MRKKSRISISAFLLLAVLLIASCSSGTATPTATSASAKSSSPADAAKPKEAVSSPTAASKAAAPASSPAAAVTPMPTARLKVSTLRNVGDVGLFVADAQGYYKEQGLEVEFVDFATAADTIAPMASGQLDIGGGGITAGLFNAFSRGIDIKVVGTKSASTPDLKNGFTSSRALAVRKDLVDSGVFKDFSDLKGKTVAVTSEGTTGHILVDRAAQKGGLTQKDVTIKRLGFPEMFVAFANKAIDAASLVEPHIARGESDGVLVRWKRANEVYLGEQVGVIMYGPKIAEIGQNVGNRFMMAYVKGLRDYNDAIGPKKKNTAQMISILAKYTPVKDPAIYERMGWDYQNPDGYVDTKTVGDNMEWFLANGFMKEKPDLTKVIDNSYADYVVKQLGKYQ